MRASVVCVLVMAVVTVGLGSPNRAVSARGAVPTELAPRCGAHGWALGALDTSRIFFDREVDKPAEPEKNNPNAEWPSNALRSSVGTVESDARYGAGASVVGQFVVDTVGCVDSSSFKVIGSADTAFTMSVRRVLRRLRYQPAEKGGQKVRSWVLWKFVFLRHNGSAAPF